MRTEAETAVTLPHVQQCLGPSGGRRDLVGGGPADNLVLPRWPPALPCKPLEWVALCCGSPRGPQGTCAGAEALLPTGHIRSCPAPKFTLMY